MHEYASLKIERMIRPKICTLKFWGPEIDQLQRNLRASLSKEVSEYSNVFLGRISHPIPGKAGNTNKQGAASQLSWSDNSRHQSPSPHRDINKLLRRFSCTRSTSDEGATRGIDRKHYGTCKEEQEPIEFTTGVGKKIVCVICA